MQATLDLSSLKPFTRALTCLSKYGDDLIIHAEPDFILLSSTNSSKSAYCSFRYAPDFFNKYSFGSRKEYGGIPVRAGPSRVSHEEGVEPCRNQLLTKSLLSILKQKSMEKNVEKCDITIVDGSQSGDADDDEDSLESKLIIRLHCKHGIIKTHRLVLNMPATNDAPLIINSPTESRIIVNPQTVKDIIEHFPNAKGGPKSDPQLVWRFDDCDLVVRSLEGSIGDGKGKAQLSTELNVDPDEFETYSIFATPVIIAFHLREFNASISYADQSSIQSIDLRFTDPAAPLFGRCESLDCEVLFIISTMQVRGEDIPAPSQRRASQRGNTNANANTSKDGNGVGGVVNGTAKKRVREDDTDQAQSRTQQPPPNGIAASAGGSADIRRKSMKVVQRSDAPASTAASISANFSRQDNSTQMQSPHPQPGADTHANSILPASRASSYHPNGNNNDNEPLFLPAPASQHSVAADEALREAGLGIEDMNENEILEMLEGEGEEVGLNVGSQFSKSQVGATTRQQMDDDGPDDMYVDMDVDVNHRTEEEGRISTPEVETLSNGLDGGGPDSLEIYEEDGETMEFVLGPTQRPQPMKGGREEGEKEFRPLFED